MGLIYEYENRKVEISKGSSRVCFEFMSSHLSESYGEVQSEEQPLSRVPTRKTAECKGAPTVTFGECFSQRQQNSRMYMKMG
jgi:hypothetical protein